MLADPAEARRQIGVSGQNAAVDENLTGFENLDMVGRLYHLGASNSRVRARELLEQFDLADAGDRPAKTYSGGMRRRLDLAGALVARPPVLFLDEPTTGLDPRSRSDLWTVIGELVHGGTTLLLTTQYLEEAERLADNILVIDRGTSIAEGTADELKAKVGGERLELVASSDADVETILSTITDVGSERPVVDGRRICLPVATGPKALMEAVRRLDENDIELHDVGLRRPTLDDVFLALTGHGAEDSETTDTEASAMTMAATLGDGWTVTRRNLFAMSRNPEVVVWSTIQPVMFIVLFVYVFDSIPTPGLDYVDYVMAGIFVQTVMFNSALTGVGLATDIQKGIIDRFRSLPMARSAVLVGRTTGDIVNGLAQLVVMVVVGFIVGWRTDASAPSVLAGLFLVLAIGYVFSWISATVGLSVGSVEVANSAGFVWMFPVTFVSSTFVDINSLNGVVRTIAEWNPMSAFVTAIRELFGNTSEEMPQPDVWPLQNPILATVLWLLVILAIFVPLSVRQYKKAASR